MEHIIEEMLAEWQTLRKMQTKKVVAQRLEDDSQTYKLGYMEGYADALDYLVSELEEALAE
jgi:hypothetical protein